jgi:hypothetical protein
VNVGERGNRILEVIHLRLAGRGSEELAQLTVEAILEARETGAHVYRHSRVGSDLLVQFHREAPDGDDSRSDVGSRLASLLREHGIVEHSVWIEHSNRGR